MAENRCVGMGFLLWKFNPKCAVKCILFESIVSLRKCSLILSFTEENLVTLFNNTFKMMDLDLLG